jgi:hypothetical protein
MAPELMLPLMLLSQPRPKSTLQGFSGLGLALWAYADEPAAAHSATVNVAAAMVPYVFMSSLLVDVSLAEGSAFAVVKKIHVGRFTDYADSATTMGETAKRSKAARRFRIALSGSTPYSGVKFSHSKAAGFRSRRL